MFYDSLTGLPNAVLFVDRLQQSLAHAARTNTQVALVYLDIDRFRQIVETNGTVIGDGVLQELAVRLKHCALRQEDTVARLCGDHFVMVLGDIDGNHGIKNVLNKIVATTQQKFYPDSLALSVRLSIGASLYPFDGAEWSALLRCASMSMRQAKTAGGNCYFCYEGGNQAREKHAADRTEILPSEMEIRPSMPKLPGKFWMQNNPALNNPAVMNAN